MVGEPGALGGPGTVVTGTTGTTGTTGLFGYPGIGRFCGGVFAPGLTCAG
jgi:hypothetical protein